MPWIGELRDLRQNRRKLTNPTAKIVQPHESVETVLVRVNTFAASSWSWAICASIIGRFSSIARRGQIACETPSAKRKGQVFEINPIFVDVLTEGRCAVSNMGAQQLINQAVEAELEELLGQYSGRRTDDGNAVVVRNGHLPERDLQTGLGPVTVKILKVRSKAGEPVTFHSTLVPPYVHKTKSLEAA